MSFKIILTFKYLLSYMKIFPFLKMSHVVTVISKTSQLPSNSIDEISKFIDTKLNLRIVSVKILSPKKAIDFLIDLHGEDDSVEKHSCHCKEDQIKINEIMKANPFDDFDLIFQKNNAARKEKKLFVFDMDSTLIKQEVIEMIAAYADVEDEVAKITTSAMNGEIDFKESLKRRVGLLKGIESKNLWDELKLKIEITPGAKELCKGLKKTGCKLAVLSGGFIPLARYVADELELDYAFANTLATEVNESGVEILSGATIGEIVDGTRKAELLLQIAKENEIDPKKAVAVGDGANDLLMMKEAGWGVAWNAKPKVQLVAPSCLNSDTLKDIYYILGYNDIEIEELLN